MARPALEVADILRDHGPAWREANRGHVRLEQLKVMSAIERCRTAPPLAQAPDSCASKKGAQPSLVQTQELPPLFSALSEEGQRSGRDKYDLDFEFGPGSLCKRLRIACRRRR